MKHDFLSLIATDIFPCQNVFRFLVQFSFVLFEKYFQCIPLLHLCRIGKYCEPTFIILCCCLCCGDQQFLFYICLLACLFVWFFKLFIYLWLCWVFISVRGLSLVAASGGRSSSRCAGLSLSRPRLLRSTGSRRAGSAIVAHGPRCSAACGIFPDQGSNPCPLHQQADSQPLRHQGSPACLFLAQEIFLHLCL